MALVSDRINASKPPPAAADPKKTTAAQLNNNKDLDVDLKKDEPSFFGSFFSANKAAKKKGGPIMEAVSNSCHGFSGCDLIVISNLSPLRLFALRLR